jgi:hypothetical protein
VGSIRSVGCTFERCADFEMLRRLGRFVATTQCSELRLGCRKHELVGKRMQPGASVVDFFLYRSIIEGEGKEFAL